ncbi:MAG TPA: hypothetical protein VK003_20765 [Oceanobacillus sp.]|nr:hypothetical protein [Oceanobacillus sp.]
MSNLTNGQKWVIVAFAAAILSIGATFFLEGEVRTFAYIIISMGVGLYAVLSSSSRKTKRDS